jgi:hypothetical protein
MASFFPDSLESFAQKKMIYITNENWWFNGYIMDMSYGFWWDEMWLDRNCLIDFSGISPSKTILHRWGNQIHNAVFGGLTNNNGVLPEYWIQTGHSPSLLGFPTENMVQYYKTLLIQYFRVYLISVELLPFLPSGLHNNYDQPIYAI